jgi:hypothetical protein
MSAQLIAVRLNSVGRMGNEHTAPLSIGVPEDIRPKVQEQFNTFLRGVAGYVLVYFKGKLWQCERDNVDPSKPYVRHGITYHPLANKFFTSQTVSPVVVPAEA